MRGGGVHGLVGRYVVPLVIREGRRIFRTALFLLLLTGCGTGSGPVYISTGTVRSLWCGTPYRDACSIVWETDDGHLETIVLAGVPPVWIGLHGDITYFHRDENVTGVYTLVSFERR